MFRELNMTKGLENTGGDLTFYKGLLQDFFDTYSKHVEKIMLFVSEKNYKFAELEVHSLKGTSHMLGFEKVYDMALKMELSLKGKDKAQFNQLIQPLSDELECLFKKLEQSDLLKKTDEDHVSLKLNKEQKSILSNKLNALLPVVKAGRYQAEALVSELLTEFADFGLKKKLSRLKTLIDQLEFEEAYVLIKTIQREL